MKKRNTKLALMSMLLVSLTAQSQPLVNLGMVGVGRLPGDSFDQLGPGLDTLGGIFSGMWVDHSTVVHSNGTIHVAVLDIRFAVPLARIGYEDIKRAVIKAVATHRARARPAVLESDIHVQLRFQYVAVFHAHDHRPRTWVRPDQRILVRFTPDTPQPFTDNSLLRFNGVTKISNRWMYAPDTSPPKDSICTRRARHCKLVSSPALLLISPVLGIVRHFSLRSFR